MATNKIFEFLRDLKLDRTGVAQQLNQVRDDINGFNQRIKDQTPKKIRENHLPKQNIKKLESKNDFEEFFFG